MLLRVPQVLNANELKQMQALMAKAEWIDGKVTAGTQSAQVKRNIQLPETSADAEAARQIVLKALSRNALFFSAALPKKIYPPLFNQYRDGMDFGSHIDNAVRTHAISGMHVRTDISCTLFITDPESYDGGELVVEDTYGQQMVKLPAGDMVMYPGTSLHHVRPVTRGARLASFFWVQSMIRDDVQRTLLFDMDAAIVTLRQQMGDTAPVIRLTGNYHNLIRMWADT
ncbi:PKHD-type hydroxylase [mine drainage metagenome]|uniref:PKHD-type hydroxylase n=1 Tax=mine drainage metagenome TaxID=410659 RepID=A0A1J5SV10_9ZZZZ